MNSIRNVSKEQGNEDSEEQGDGGRHDDDGGADGSGPSGVETILVDDSISGGDVGVVEPSSRDVAEADKGGRIGASGGSDEELLDEVSRDVQKDGGASLDDEDTVLGTSIGIKTESEVGDVGGLVGTNRGVGDSRSSSLQVIGRVGHNATVHLPVANVVSSVHVGHVVVGVVAVGIHPSIQNGGVAVPDAAGSTLELFIDRIRTRRRREDS